MLKNQKIGTRLGINSAIAVFCAAMIAFLATFFLLKNIIDKNDDATAEGNGEFIISEIGHIKDEMKLTANIFASDNVVSEGVENNDIGLVLAQVKKLDEYIGFATDNITFIGLDGTVLGRYYSDEKGDSMADKGFFKKASTGEVNADLTSSQNIPLGIRAAAPVVNKDGTIVGVVSVTFDMSDEEFLKDIKGDDPEEYSIFAGTKIINSTMSSFVGAEMDEENKAIIMDKGERNIFETTLDGNDFNVAMGPLKNDSGEVLGAYFAGANIQEGKTQELISIIAALGICVLAVVVAVVVVAMITRKHVTKPIASLVDVSTEMSQGNLQVAVTTTEGGEIGTLGAALQDVISKLQVYIGDISEHMNNMANGDLTHQVTRDYIGDFADIKTSINHIAGSLNNTLSSINIAAEQVNAGAEQVANSAQALSQGATEQASSIQELSGSIMSVSEQVKQTAKNVNTAGDYVAQSEKGIENSSNYMDQMMAAMHDISESSAQISKVVKVIDDIAFQTNILALNAAVEAARAGAAGKGFSVVADEVRNLASKSAEAVKQTTDLIESAVSSAEKGVSIAEQTSHALESVKTQSEMVVDIIQKIQKASNEQAEAINQITIGVEQISSVVQTNSATSQESAAASQELSGQARMLQDEVSHFRLSDALGGVRGNNGHSNPAPFVPDSSSGGGMSSMDTPDSFGSDNMSGPDMSAFTIDLDSDKY